MESIKRVLKIVVALSLFSGVFMIFIGGGSRTTKMRDRKPEMALFGGVLAIISLAIMVVPQIIKEKNKSGK